MPFITRGRNFINTLERIPQTIEQYKEKNAVLGKDIPQLQEIVGKQWKKEDELKGLKSELAALDQRFKWNWRKTRSLNNKRLQMVMMWQMCRHTRILQVRGYDLDKLFNMYYCQFEYFGLAVFLLCNISCH